jgi:hypothetical protein
VVRSMTASRLALRPRYCLVSLFFAPRRTRAFRLSRFWSLRAFRWSTECDKADVRSRSGLERLVNCRLLLIDAHMTDQYLMQWSHHGHICNGPIMATSAMAAHGHKLRFQTADHPTAHFVLPLIQAPGPQYAFQTHM